MNLRITIRGLKNRISKRSNRKVNQPSCMQSADRRRLLKPACPIPRESERHTIYVQQTYEWH